MFTQSFNIYCYRAINFEYNAPIYPSFPTPGAKTPLCYSVRCDSMQDHVSGQRLPSVKRAVASKQVVKYPKWKYPEDWLQTTPLMPTVSRCINAKDDVFCSWKVRVSASVFTSTFALDADSRKGSWPVVISEWMWLTEWFQVQLIERNAVGKTRKSCASRVAVFSR